MRASALHGRAFAGADREATQPRLRRSEERLRAYQVQDWMFLNTGIAIRVAESVMAPPCE